jgi:flagellar hook protein FlgE
MIANNIANVNTVGFKRSEASFFSLVTTAGRSSKYAPGTVQVSRTQAVNQQGPIQQTSSATDAAISGNGFFAVKRSDQAGQEFLYTRSGSFSEDSQGLMRNTAGFMLYAWPIDSAGNLPANQGDLTSLVPANVAFLGGLTRPTSTAELAINLDADEVDYNSHLFTTSSTLPVGGGQLAHFTRGLTVYDSLGTAQTLTFEYRKVTGPMAHATTQASGLDLTTSLTDPAVFPGIAVGDQFSIDVGNGPTTFTVVDPSTGNPGDIATVGELLDQINTTFDGGTSLDATLDSNGRIVFQTIDPTATLTFAEITGNPLTTAGTSLDLAADPSAVDANPLTYHQEAELQGPFTTYPNQGDFPTFQNVTNPNTQGWWEVSILHPDGSTLSQGLLNFDGDGSLNASNDANGNVDINLTNIDWFNGSSPQDIDVDISRFSQFSGNYDVIFSDQNGAELGLRTGVELTRDGIIRARFSNGATADLYKIPLITFANANGLTEVSGTAYTENDASGEENLREAGTGGAGFLEPSTVESSNVDLADEFAKLIVSQRAYTANTRVINTVDQMTEDLLRLR